VVDRPRFNFFYSLISESGWIDLQSGQSVVSRINRFDNSGYNLQVIFFKKILLNSTIQKFLGSHNPVKRTAKTGLWMSRVNFIFYTSSLDAGEKYSISIQKEIYSWIAGRNLMGAGSKRFEIDSWASAQLMNCGPFRFSTGNFGE